MLFCWCHTCKGLFKIQGKKMFHTRISFLANWATKLMPIYKNRINYITYHHIAGIYRAGVFYLGTVVPKSLDFSSAVQKKKKAKQIHLSCVISLITRTGLAQVKESVNIYKCCFLNILPEWLKLKFNCFSKYPIPANSNFQSHELYTHLWIFWLSHCPQLPIPSILVLQRNHKPHHYTAIQRSHSTQCTWPTQPCAVIMPATQSFGHHPLFDKGLALWTNSTRKN